jgi:rod shape-determining protein MreD
MIRSTLLSAIVVLCLDYIQATWFGPIRVLGVAPDLALLFIVWTAYRGGPIVGAATGFISGFALDGISAAPLGYSSFLRTCIAWLASLLHGSFTIDRILFPFLLGALATVFKALASLLLELLFGDAVKAYDFFASPLWLETAYTALAAPIAFLLFSLSGRFIKAPSERA